MQQQNRRTGTKLCEKNAYPVDRSETASRCVRQCRRGRESRPRGSPGVGKRPNRICRFRFLVSGLRVSPAEKARATPYAQAHQRFEGMSAGQLMHGLFAIDIVSVGTNFDRPVSPGCGQFQSLNRSSLYRVARRGLTYGLSSAWLFEIRFRR